MINIFTNQAEKPVRNFWNHIVFHPTDAIEEEMGQKILNKIAEEGASKSVRIYSMFEEMVTLDEEGKMVFDFTMQDRRIDYLLEKGFELVIAYAFFPYWMAADPKLYKERYHGLKMSLSYPRDYGEWGEICRIFTQHLVDRYGEDTVARWHIHCYNEPDLHHFFYRESDNAHRLAEYCKLYDAFEEAVTSVSRRIPIGGPALSESPEHFEFLEMFLNHIRESGRKLDYVALHSYGTFPEKLKAGESAFDIRGALKNTLTVIQIMKMCGFADTELLCDEWGACTEGYLGADLFPELIFRENEQYAMYFVKMLTLFDEMNLPYERMMICLSGQHDLKKNFGGHRNFFTRDFFAKPLYNAYVLASKLEGEKLYFYADLDLEDCSFMPVRLSNGTLRVLIGYGDDAGLRKLPTREIHLQFNGMRAAAEACTASAACAASAAPTDCEACKSASTVSAPVSYRVRETRIDANHANAYTAFCKLGSPADPNEAEQEIIRKEALLKTVDLGTVSACDGKADVTLTVEDNTVLLLELIPE